MNKREVPDLPISVEAYKNETGALTTLAHGAYTLLLMRYWQTGPLPDDDAQLAYIAKLSASSWKRIRPEIVKLFRECGGQLHHDRLDQRLAARTRLSIVRSSIGKLRSAPKPAEISQTTPAIAQQLLSNCCPAPQQLLPERPLPRQPDLLGPIAPKPTLEPEVLQKTTVKPKKNAVVETPEFLAFWAAYPRKEDKGHARIAFAGALRKATADAIMAGLKAYKFNPERNLQPLAATWLHGERWGDESEKKPEPVPPVHVSQMKPGTVFSYDNVPEGLKLPESLRVQIAARKRWEKATAGNRHSWLP